MASFVTVYNVRNEKVEIPEHWLSDPVLAKGFTKGPRKNPDPPAGEPGKHKGHKATHETPATGDQKKE